MRTLRLGLICVILHLLGREAFAAAWTNGKGHGQIILTTSWFRTTQGYDRNGNLHRFGYGGSFRKFNINPYIEYGVTNRTTLVLNTTAPFLRYQDQFNAFSSSGLGDMEVGVRQRLTSSSSRTVVAVQGTTSFPTYSENRNPTPGNRQVDVEPRLLVGRGYQYESRSLFWNAETAFRLRTGAPADQVRLDGTIGANVNRRLMLMGQSFGIKGLRNGTRLYVGTNPNAQSDFDLYKYRPLP